MSHIPWLAYLLQNDEWRFHLQSEFERQEFKTLADNLDREYQAGKTIYPPRELIFNAFNLTPLSKIKVVILGQDPYPNEGQAMGLAFSVPMDIPIPQSLNNMFKELEMDPYIEFNQPSKRCLTHWAQQGVFLLNKTLTVEAGTSDSHAGFGWQMFTDHVIQVISKNRPHVVFILMGKPAQEKARLIDPRHAIISTSHPATRSASRSLNPVIFSIPIPFNGNIPIAYNGSVHISFNHIQLNGRIRIPFKGFIPIPLNSTIHIPLNGSIPIQYNGSIHITFNGIPFDGRTPIPFNGSILIDIMGIIPIPFNGTIQVPFDDIIQNSFDGIIIIPLQDSIPIRYDGSILIAINGIIPTAFKGSQCFSRCNYELRNHNKTPIDWNS